MLDKDPFPCYQDVRHRAVEEGLWTVWEPGDNALDRQMSTSSRNLRNTSKNQNDYIRQVKESWAKVAQDTKRKWEAVHEDMEKLANSAESVEQVQARPNLFANVFKAWTEGVNNEVVSHGSPGEPACKKRSWSEEIVCASCVAEEKNGEGLTFEI